MSKFNKSKQDLIELEAFYKAIEGTIPLAKRNRVSLANSKYDNNNLKRKVENFNFKEKEVFHCYEKLNLDEVSGEDLIFYKQSSVSNKVFQQLRQKQSRIDAILDLHGANEDEAMIAINNFLHQCIDKHAKIGLIIHGKGHRNQAPILKNKLNHWLRGLNIILAFCSAAPSHGGGGAIYILLKRKSLPAS